MRIESLVPTVLIMNDSYWLPYALSALRGRFNRYVIYDVGSEDGTSEIVDWFVNTEPAEFFVRKIPYCSPIAQGAFRNSMLAEAQTDWTLMVDGDEIYAPSALDALARSFASMDLENVAIKGKRYGVFRRTELSEDLLQKHTEVRTHHRLYHRTAIFKGNHPGEVPVIKQHGPTEYDLPEVMCYHFHNTQRSKLEVSVPKRLDRKGQSTYHPGDLTPFNLLDELPALRKPIETFKVSPVLEQLQHAFNSV